MHRLVKSTRRRSRRGVAALAVSVLGGVGIVPTLAASSVAEVKARGTLVMVCVPHQENNFVHTNLEAGPMPRRGGIEHFAGVDVDLMHRFASELGVELEIRPALDESGFPSYRELVQRIHRGEADVGASSLSITPAREKLVDFSIPYHATDVVVITRGGVELEGPDALPALTASAIPGSSQEEHMLRLGLRASAISSAEFMLENYRNVEEGRVDFTLVDSASAERMLPQFSNLKIALRLPPEDSYGVAVPEGSDLKPALDRFFTLLSASGELERIKESHRPGR